MNTKIRVALCCIGMLFCMAASPSFGAEKMVIGISTPTADHGWTGGIIWWAQRAITEFGTKYPNLEFVYLTSDSDKEQMGDVDALLDKGIQALVILPHKPAPMSTALNKAHKSGAFIVVVDRSIPKVPKDVYLAGDNYGFGRECGVYLAEALQGKGKVVVMEGIPCEGNSLRVDGFKEGIKKSPDIVILDSQPAYWNPSKGYELMRDYLQQFPEIDAVWCGDDDVLEEALKAYEESGRKDVSLFLGGGGSKHILKMIGDGHPLVRATVTYPPNMGYEGIRMAVEKLMEGKEFDKEIVLPSELVTRKNAAEHYFPDNIY